MNYFKKVIYNALIPLIGKECVLLDAPYYPNVGDSLIWEGVEQMIGENGIRCRYRSSIDTFEEQDLSGDVSILLMGGGNFGDLWRGLQEFRNSLVQRYPNNRIIILPQSVRYYDNDFLSDDVDVFSHHKNLIICARDKDSYDFLSEKFSRNNVLLLPDMAFCINLKKYIIDIEVRAFSKKLFLLRGDDEAISYPNVRDAFISDWPTCCYESTTLSKNVRINKNRYRLLRFTALLFKRYPIFIYQALSLKFLYSISHQKEIGKNWNVIYDEFQYLSYLNKKNNHKFSGVINWLMFVCHRPIIVKYGCSFINQFDTIVSTRLHGAIAGYLLGKETFWLNNSYGKNKAYFDTWLRDSAIISEYSCNVEDNS